MGVEGRHLGTQEQVGHARVVAGKRHVGVKEGAELVDRLRDAVDGLAPSGAIRGGTDDDDPHGTARGAYRQAPTARFGASAGCVGGSGFVS